MMALEPRAMARTLALVGVFITFFHFAERIVAGFARCPLEGCLPW